MFNKKFLRRVYSKLNRLYVELKLFEDKIISTYDQNQPPDYLTRLGDMKRRAIAIKILKSVDSVFYTLRTSIDCVCNYLNPGDHLANKTESKA